MRLRAYLIALVLVQAVLAAGLALAQDSEDAEEAATREAYRADFIQTCRALAGDRVAAEYRAVFQRLLRLRYRPVGDGVRPGYTPGHGSAPQCV